MDQAAVLTNIRVFERLGLGTPLLLVMILAMIVVPLPVFALDIFFTFNIVLALAVILVVIYVSRPLDFAVFPTVLLVATLLRLALNVASTRIVLLKGHAGGDAAGKVIEAFGEFVIGGNYAVGIVVFVILVIINFVVVTKGAGRVSEVSARFTLDAMPGKQMAIDADLNAGLITQEEAKQRREETSQEADFYGAMDGASKFVRGDAIAGILIVFINIFAGLTIGMFQHNLTLSQALQNYVLLTIGDGLVAQIPSLVLSTATAIIITRVSRTMDLGQQVLAQLTSNPRVLVITAGVIGSLGVIPGMPNVAFLSLAGLVGGCAYLATKRKEKITATEAQAEETESPKSREYVDISWDDVQPVDIVGLEVGYRLIPLVDRNQGGELLARIKGVRKKLSQDLGFLIQAVHIRDNLDFDPNAYRISLLGVPVGEAVIQPDRILAINPGQVFGELAGDKVKEPSFELDAVWIEHSQREHALTMGYTVVDPSTVVATHLSKILQEHTHELLGTDEVQHMLDMLAKSAPKLVEDLVPKTIPIVVIRKVLQNLLEEKIPIRDIRTIAEILAEYAPKSQDPAALTAMVRIALGRSIVQHINGMKTELSVIILEPTLEHILQESQIGAENGIVVEPGLAKQLIRELTEQVHRQEVTGLPPVLLVTPQLRLPLAKLLRPAIPGLHVLAYPEIPENKQIKISSTIGNKHS